MNMAGPAFRHRPEGAIIVRPISQVAVRKSAGEKAVLADRIALRAGEWSSTSSIRRGLRFQP